MAQRVDSSGRAPTVDPHTTYAHPYVRLNVLVDHPIFVAGQQLTGIVEIACSSAKVSLGEISLELQGTENLTSNDHSASKIFLQERVFFQRHGLPPSNAVDGDAVGGFWPARKGRCRFSFAFALPESAPTCGIFGGNAELQYNLKAVAQVQHNRERSLVTRVAKVNVVERWSDFDHFEFWEHVQDEASDRPTFAGSSGAVTLRAFLPRRLYWRPLEGEAGARHDSLEVKLHVRNTTNKPVTGAKISISRRLKLLATASKRPGQLPPAPLITEVVTEEPLHGRQYDWMPGDDRGMTIALDLPRGIATLRKTALFEIQLVVRVELNMGLLSKGLAVELPIFAGHPESMPSRAHYMPAHVSGMPAHRATSPLPLPRPPHSRAGGIYSPTMPPASPYPDHRFDLPSHIPGMPLPPARPWTGASGYIAFDPHVPDLTPSRLYSPAPPPDRALYAVSPSLPSWSPALRSAGTPSRPLPTPIPGPSRPWTAIDPRVVDRTAGRCMSPEERDVILANLAPVPGYSGATRAGPTGAQEVRRSMAVRRSSAPLELPEPELGEPGRPGHTLQRAHSASNLRSAPTPPPLAPSSRFYTPPTVIPVHELDRQANPLGLDTIGEAGESRAGTLVNVPSQLEAYVEAQELAEALERSLRSPPVPSGKPHSGRRTSLPTAMEIFANPSRSRPASPPTPKSIAPAAFEPLPPIPRTSMVTSPSEGLLALTARLASRPNTPSAPLSPKPVPAPRPGLERSTSSSGLLIARASERSLRAAYVAAHPLARPATTEALQREAADKVTPWLASSPPIELPPPAAREEPRTTIKLQAELRELLRDLSPATVESVTASRSAPAGVALPLAPLEPSPAATAPVLPPKLAASVTMASSTPAAKPSPRRTSLVTAISKGEADEPPEYDHRSARGGRGGLVTSVAMQWASLAKGEAERAKSPKLAVVRPIALRFDARKMPPPPVPSAVRGAKTLQDAFKSSPSPATTSTQPPFSSSTLTAHDRMQLSPVASAPHNKAAPSQATLTPSARPTPADLLARAKQERARQRSSAPIGVGKAIATEGAVNLTLTKPATLAPPSVLRPIPRRASDWPPLSPKCASASTKDPETQPVRGDGKFAALLSRYAEAAAGRWTPGL